MNVIRAVGSGVLELLAPRRCAACDLFLGEAEAGFCAGCAPLLDRAGPAFRPPALSAAVFQYGGPIAAAIQGLKYRECTDLAATLGALLATAAAPYAGRIEGVVPMALHPRRLRARGFNQAALLAGPVARGLGVPLLVGRLKRVRDTATQAGLSRVDRSRNLSGAFVGVGDGRGERVLLIDDVRTTGATLAAAAEALLRSGHSLVMTLALARADL